MTTDNTSVHMDTNKTWICPHCCKTYSKNYKYKTHLTKCLVHQDHLETKYSLMGDLMNDLKEELLSDFKHQLSELVSDIRSEFRNNVKSNSLNNNQATQKKQFLNMFDFK